MQFGAAAEKYGWRLKNIQPESEIAPPAFDSRKLNVGELFFALKGALDGGKFALDAWRKGAQAVVVTPEWINTLPSDAAAVIVDDTLKALTDLARLTRAAFTGNVLAVSGSCGKTGAKELFSYVLSQKYRVLKNPASFNNHIGLPCTLARLGNEYDIAVLEIGANHPGEIADLCRIAAPTAGLITMIGNAHLEGFGDIRGVAKAKGELFRSLSGDKTAFVNFDDPNVIDQSAGLKNRIGYGFAFPPEGQQFRRIYQGISSEHGFAALDQEFEFHQPDFLKIHALAALAVAHYWGVEIDKIKHALKTCPALKGRMQRFEKDGIIFYDDTYNANPTSVAAALNFIAGFKHRRKIAVLADMLELGNAAIELHRRILEAADKLGFAKVFTLGENYLKAGSKDNYTTPLQTAEKLKKLLRKGDIILFKGSRLMKVEQVLDYFIPNRNTDN